MTRVRTWSIESNPCQSFELDFLLSLVAAVSPASEWLMFPGHFPYGNSFVNEIRRKHSSTLCHHSSRSYHKWESRATNSSTISSAARIDLPVFGQAIHCLHPRSMLNEWHRWRNQSRNCRYSHLRCSSVSLRDVSVDHGGVWLDEASSDCWLSISCTRSVDWANTCEEQRDRLSSNLLALHAVRSRWPHPSNQSDRVENGPSCPAMHSIEWLEEKTINADRGNSISYWFGRLRRFSSNPRF